ncbi:MAG: mannosyltransferase, partial [Flavobacteriaceae bacterium]|nr:mannosyltransferase [Flavobacteriaceae bacterium]
MPLQSLTHILKFSHIVPLLICLLMYADFAYDLERTNYPKLIVLFAILFVLFFNFVKNKIYDLRFLTSISILFRVVFLLAIPNLSQDFYR